MVPPLVDTGAPGHRPLIQDKVAEAIDRSEGDLSKADEPAKTKPARRSSPRPRRSPAGRSARSSDGYAANETEDLDAAC